MNKTILKQSVKRRPNRTSNAPEAWPMQPSHIGRYSQFPLLSIFNAHTTSPKASSAVRAPGQEKNTFARALHNICAHGIHAEQELHCDVAAQVGTTMSLALDSGLGIAGKEGRKEGRA